MMRTRSMTGRQPVPNDTGYYWIASRKGVTAPMVQAIWPEKERLRVDKFTSTIADLEALVAEERGIRGACFLVQGTNIFEPDVIPTEMGIKNDGEIFITGGEVHGPQWPPAFYWTLPTSPANGPAEVQQRDEQRREDEVAAAAVPTTQMAEVERRLGTLELTTAEQLEGPSVNMNVEHFADLGERAVRDGTEQQYDDAHRWKNELAAALAAATTENVELKRRIGALEQTVEQNKAEILALKKKRVDAVGPAEVSETGNGTTLTPAQDFVVADSSQASAEQAQIEDRLAVFCVRMLT
ncbi:hypothetical protein M3Y99_01302900 [Aphelenchoides fujianensis]|nr:hypothetical protein M3Y99_01302900 [Aphelenchoides fujianensis]